MSNSDDAQPPDDTPPDPGEGRYCIDCFYPLKGLQSPGQCPECGCGFDFADMYSYSLESRPPTLVQRAKSHRVVALLVAIVLGCAPLMGESWVCTLVLLYPLWQFAIVWLMFVALGLDRLSESIPVFVASGAAIGMVSVLPYGWTPTIFIGTLSGAVCGLYMLHLKATGWLD